MRGSGFEPESFPCPPSHGGGVNQAVPSSLYRLLSTERCRKELNLQPCEGRWFSCWVLQIQDQITRQLSTAPCLICPINVPLMSCLSHLLGKDMAGFEPAEVSLRICNPTQLTALPHILISRICANDTDKIRTCMPTFADARIAAV